jgi:uncharacterized repeat protein (TIGR01451 family)
MNRKSPYPVQSPVDYVRFQAAKSKELVFRYIDRQKKRFMGWGYGTEYMIDLSVKRLRCNPTPSISLMLSVVFALLVLLPAVAVGETPSLTKSAPITAREGSLIAYRLKVVNQGTVDVPGIRILDTLPDEVEFVQAESTPGGTFDPATGIWALPTLGTGAEDSAAALQIQALVRSGLLTDPNDTVSAINSAAFITPALPPTSTVRATTNILCSFCIDWEILAVAFNTEHRAQPPNFRETRFVLDVQVANNGPVASEGSVSATRFAVSGGGFSPSLSLEPSLPVPVSLDVGDTRTITFATNWTEGPFSTYTISWEFEVSDTSLLDPVLPNTESGSWTGDASDRDDETRCVVALAASGSYLDPHLPGVRRFRDQTLMRSRFGQMLVNWYYELSPALARRIERNETLRSVTRIVLTPVVFAIESPVLALCLLTGTLFLAFAHRNRVRRERSAGCTLTGVLPQGLFTPTR